MTKSPTTMFWISSVDPIDSSEKELPFERSYTNVDKRPAESRTREARRQIQGVEEKGYEEERREYRTETQNGGKWEAEKQTLKDTGGEYDLMVELSNVSTGLAFGKLLL